MNKAEFIEAVAKTGDLSKTAAAAAVDAVLEAISQTLKKGGDVTLIGFGSFKVAKRAARVGRNPATGEALKIKASKSPKFTAGKTLKDLVNKK